jgi:hypothetical protein
LIAQDDELDLKPGIAESPNFEFIALSMSSAGFIGLPNGRYCANWLKRPQKRPMSSISSGSLGSDRTRKGSEPEHLTVWDREGECLFPLPVVNVMLIERTGGDRARRVSVGWVYLTSWVSARPEFRMIYLE